MMHLSTTGAFAADTKTSSAVAATSSCPSVKAATLTFACDGACPNQACIAPAASDDSAMCQCLALNATAPTTYTSFTLLIPLDDKSNAELSKVKDGMEEKLRVNGTSDIESVSWVSTTAVKNIAPLKLPSTVNTVTIRGGDSLISVYKGYFVNVEIDPNFLADAPQVTSVELPNIRLLDQIEKIVAKLPSGVTTLDVRNAALTAFPQSVKSIEKLTHLDLAFNNIQNMTDKHALSNLTKLCLNANDIKSFETHYPELDHLDLGGNILQAAPEVLPQYKKLTKLFLGDNRIAEFGQSSEVNSVTDMMIYRNGLTSFSAYMPNLVKLNLNENKLRDIPAVVYSLEKLKELHVWLNSEMLNLAFTNAQANFLYHLDAFSISTTSLDANCSNDQKYKLKSAGNLVCITDGKDVATIEGDRIVAPPPARTQAPTSAPTPTPAPTPTSSGLLAPIISGSAAAVLVVALVLLYAWRRRKSTNKRNTQHAINDTTGGGTYGWTSDVAHHNVPLWRDDEFLRLKVSSDDISDMKKIGSGAFADVWLVQFRDEELLASKRLRASNVTPQHTQDFIDEIKLVAVLKHPSIVEFKGVAWIREADLQALFEFMDRGDLRTYLMDPETPTHWSVEKVQIAIDVVEALVYVHSFLPPLVHRDLKSRNVLLCNGNDGSNDGVRAKLTDFGVSRYRSEQNTMTAGVGTGRWLAPEVIAGAGNYGPPADMFSFGVVLYELDSHAIPYANERGANGNKLPDVAILQRVAEGQLTPSMSATCPLKIHEIARACFALDPSKRPAAPEIAYELRTLQKNFKGGYHVV